MSFVSILFIAVGLGMDAFTVAVGAGVTVSRVSFGPVFRLAFHFGFFQFAMPIVGWAAGRTVATYIAHYDHWLAFGLLACVGGKMIIDALKDGAEVSRKDPTRGVTLVMLSVATSIDALAVGLSLAFLNVNILYPSVVIGVVAALMTTVGMIFGDLLSRFAGRKVGIAGGLILIGIGIKILAEHLLA